MLVICLKKSKHMTVTLSDAPDFGLSSNSRLFRSANVPARREFNDILADRIEVGRQATSAYLTR